MDGLAWQLLALLLTVTSGCNVKRQPPAPTNDVIISLPKELFIDVPNRIIINSEKRLSKVSISMVLPFVKLNDAEVATFHGPIGKKSKAGDRYTYNLKYSVPIELEPGGYFTLKVSYSYNQWKYHRRGRANIVVEKSVDAMVRLVQRFVVIMGETDKPLYRPGEQVRFRFIALTSRHILPHSESPTWPKYQAVGEFWQLRTLRPIEAAERKKRLQAPQFDCIAVRDPLNNVVHQWNDVQPLDALHLAHTLISDAKEGEWKIEARVRDHEETITFNVKHYILPRFQAHVELPKSIPLTKPDVTFSICAAYTNGPFLRGTFDAQVCICDKDALQFQQKAKSLFTGSMCNSSHYPVPRHCKRISGILDDARCTKITTQMFQQKAYEAPRWRERLGVFVEIVEGNTSVSTFASDIVEFQSTATPLIELKLPNTYKNSLPIVGQVVCRDLVDGDQQLMVAMRTKLQKCNDDGNLYYEDVTILIKSISVKAGTETHDLVIPPVILQDPAYTTFRSVSILNSDASKQMKLWDANEGFAIQVTVVNTTSITCPGIVKLQVQSNKALPNNTILTLQFLSRGQLTARGIKLDPDHACVPHDNEFGHYECGDGDEILCLEGWKGANCLTPVCNNIRCGSNGMCVAPGRCASWSGEESSAPEMQSRAKRRRERRTFFQHKGELELDGDFGPEFRAVAYVVNDGEMASDFVQISGLPACSSPATAETEHGGGLQFNKQLVVPGENVNMSLTVSTSKDSNGELANSCLLSIGDVSLKQFDLANFRRIDLSAFASLLTNTQAYKPVDKIYGTEDAYRAAGIKTILILSKSRNRETIKCTKKRRKQELSSWWRSDRVRVVQMSYQFDAAKFTIKPEVLEAEPTQSIYPSYSYEVDMKENKKVTADTKLRLRDFFPEVWLFETARLTNGRLKKSLTVPDTLTTWEANAVCLTADKGLWMTVKKPQLTVTMPFFVEFAPPLMARRGEVLHLPLSVFVYPETTTGFGGSDDGAGSNGVPRTCYEVEVGVDTDWRDWRVVGVAAFTTCICVGDPKGTFNLLLRPLRVGLLNVTATAMAHRDSPICGDADADADGDASGRKWAREVVTVRDAVRRSVRVIAEGVEKRVTIGGIICTSGGESCPSLPSHFTFVCYSS
ncbi:Alpha-2-macroglobulin [Taenia solium]|eukprot:TsM_000879800 transcript=TsM_000879800 gene=TsM_000879800